MELKLISLLADILDTNLLDGDLSRRCSDMLIELTKRDLLTTHTTQGTATPNPTPANTNIPLINNGDVPTVPQGTYTAKFLGCEVSKKKDAQFPILNLTFVIAEGEYKDQPLTKVMTLNQWGLTEYHKMLMKMCKDKQEYNAGVGVVIMSHGNIDTVKDVMNHNANRIYTVKFTPKTQYKGFNKLSIA